MPLTFNGIGTSYCGHFAPIARGKVGFLSQQKRDHDAVECFVIAFLPIIPIRARHTFSWNGTQCQALPIRMHRRLLLKAIARPYVLGLVGIGIAVTLIGAIIMSEKQKGDSTAIAIGITMAAVGLLLNFLLTRMERRDRDIRLVLGPHALGTSDPATWTHQNIEELARAAAGVGQQLDPQTVDALIRDREFAGAMWLSRLAAGMGQSWGDVGTDKILATPAVEQALMQLRKEPWEWGSLLYPGSNAWWPGAPVRVVQAKA